MFELLFSIFTEVMIGFADSAEIKNRKLPFWAVVALRIVLIILTAIISIAICIGVGMLTEKITGSNISRNIMLFLSAVAVVAMIVFGYSSFKNKAVKKRTIGKKWELICEEYNGQAKLFGTNILSLAWVDTGEQIKIEGCREKLKVYSVCINEIECFFAVEEYGRGLRRFYIKR